eukprot:287813-Karenia_brevis.AAC.1
MQLWYMMFPLLEKPKGGMRPVLLCPAPNRLWQKVRRPMHEEFLAGSRRKYWATGRGKAPADCVWCQAVRAEASTASGGSSATVLWD